MRLTCLYILILLAGSADAQITSIIVDKATNNPLSNASISLQNIKDSTISRTVTKDNGSFSFNAITNGQYTLTVSYVGYEAYTVGVKIADHTINTLLDTIALDHADKNLNQVIVTGKKPFVEFNPNQITLNVAQSPIATNGSAYEVIKRAPGVTENFNGLTFRGKTTLVLINGRQTYLTGAELKQMLMDMPATDIDKVQIIPNPSAKYDADAQSVIDIKLLKNNSYGVNGVFTGAIGAGEDLRYNGGLSLNYRKNRINVYGNYNYEHNQQHFNIQSDRMITPTDQIMENNQEERIRYNNDYKLGADYTINKNSTTGVLFTGYTNYRSRNSTDNITLSHAAPFVDSFSTVTMGGHAVFSTASVNVYYKTTFDTLGKTLTLNADYFNYNKKWSDNYLTSYATIDNIEYQPTYALRDSSPGNNNVYSFAVDYTNPFKKYGRIDAGLKTTYTATDNNVLWQYQNGANWLVDTSLTNHFVYNENINAAYISYDRTIEKYELTIGVRGEGTVTRSNLITTNQVHDSSYFGLFPNLRLQFTKNQNNVFSIGYHRSIQRPDFDMINPFIVYISEYSFFAGNPYLRPQLVNNFSLTYTYKKSLNLAVNYSHATNAIAAIVVTGANNSVGVISGNISTQSTASFSANWGGDIYKFWNVNISSEADYIAYSEDYEKGVLNNSNIGWVYQGQLQNTFKFSKSWAAEIGTYYHSTIPYGFYQIKPSFRMDAGIQKIILHENGKLALSLIDIFNTESINYSTNFMGINETVDYKSESRFVKLQFTYKFGNKNVKQAAARASAIADINKRMKN